MPAARKKKPSIRRKMGFVVRKWAHERYMQGMSPLRDSLRKLETLQSMGPKGAPVMLGRTLGNGRLDAELSREQSIARAGNVPTQFREEVRRSQQLLRTLEKRKRLARAIAGKKK